MNALAGEALRATVYRVWRHARGSGASLKLTLVMG
jgi:hypothetical protein